MTTKKIQIELPLSTGLKTYEMLLSGSTISERIQDLVNKTHGKALP